MSRPQSQKVEVHNDVPDWRSLYAGRRLWVANADGSGAHEIAGAGAGVASPRWTRDGRILFVRDDALWSFDLASNVAEQVLWPIVPVPKDEFGHQSNLAPPDAPYEAGSNNGFPPWESLVTWADQ